MSQVSRTVIMLSGWLQSGKDTVGAYLCESFGFKRFAFADVLKDDVSATYDIPRESLDTTAGKDAIFNQETGQTVRDLLINHGQAKRAENPDYWVSRVISTIEKMENEDPLGNVFTRIVITDWRFPNEFKSMKTYVNGGAWQEDPCSAIYGWRINRWKEPPLQDVTELALDTFKFDKVLDNTGTIEQLDSKVRDAVYKLVDFNIRILLTDVDEVLLKWIEGFIQFAKKEGYQFKDEYPTTWLLSTWMKKKDGSAMTDSEVRDLVLHFNHSDLFEHLDPCEEAIGGLRYIKSRGFHIVAISSCTDDKEAYAKRFKNLKRHFGKFIDYVVCLPLGSSKTEVLRNFPPSIWIDDNPENVAAGAALNHFSFVMKRPWNEASLGDSEDLPVFSSWNDVKDYIMMEEALGKMGDEQLSEFIDRGNSPVNPLFSSS